MYFYEENYISIISKAFFLSNQSCVSNSVNSTVCCACLPHNDSFLFGSVSNMRETATITPHCRSTSWQNLDIPQETSTGVVHLQFCWHDVKGDRVFCQWIKHVVTRGFILCYIVQLLIKLSIMSIDRPSHITDTRHLSLSDICLILHCEQRDQIRSFSLTPRWDQVRGHPLLTNTRPY